MNTKNLPLKFAFVGLIVSLSVWLIYTKGLNWGIDVRGGHSLIFEIRTNEAEIKRLEADEVKLAEKLKAADSEKDKKELRATIERLKTALKRYKEAGGDEGNLPERMIRILKSRIDPGNFRGTQWRPLGKNRIEVRMPPGKKGSQAARNAYFQALSRLEEGNIKQSDIRRLLQLPPQQRKTQIAALAGANTAQRQHLGELLAAYDTMTQQQAKLNELEAQRLELLKTSTQSPGRIEALEEKLSAARNDLQNAINEYEAKREVVQEGNVNRQDFHLTLENDYLRRIKVKQTGVRKEKARDFPSDLVIVEIETADKRLEMDLEKLRSKYPTRVGEIDEVFRRFKQWSRVRQQLDDPADLKRLIAKAGVLEFRIAPFSPDSGRDFKIGAEELQRYIKSLKTEGPGGMQKRNERFLWLPIHGDAGTGRQRYMLLYNQSGFQMLHERIGGWQLTAARPDTDQYSRPAIRFNLNEPGAKRMAKLTAAHQTHPMAILLDDEVYSAPIIQKDAIISDSGIITGTFSPEEVSDLVRTLEAGSLPARLNPEPVAESTFGPSIGEENKKIAAKAGYWGLATVAVFMLVYYLLNGFIADIALLFNILFVLGAMSMSGAAFTLPGIAGLILTVGITVDNNVLIFERLREEQAKGQSIRMAFKNAYERAFSAIFDANITTLFICGVLYWVFGWVGMEEVRGFAITLGLGVVFSMFTSLVVTRWIFQLLLDAKLIKKPIFMLHLIGTPKINWMSKRYYFWALSVGLMVIGIFSLVRQGGDIWGIEFSAGTQAIIRFKADALIDGKLPNDGMVRQRFIGEARKAGFDKLTATASVETQLNPNRVRNFLRTCDPNSDGMITVAEWTAGGFNKDFFAKIDTDDNEILTRQELSQRLPAISYQISTTETNIGRIRQVAASAFGVALQRRTSCRFDLVTGERVAELGVELAADGKTKVASALRQNPNRIYRDLLEDYRGGVMFVVRNVAPAITRGELMQRIHEMRFQPDFAGQLLHQTEVIGLKPAEGESYSAFAMLVAPAEPATVEKPAAWDSFASNELSLLSEAFGREEAMVATNFDAAIAGRTTQLAIVALLLSWLVIVGYLWFRFGSVQWGLAAVICLIHDVIIVVGLVAISGWLHKTALGEALGITSFKIDLAMVAAILTVIGYSVNDTIVVFDRIRENRGRLTTVSPAVINASINQTLSRTLLTSGTTFIVVSIMYVWGGPSIHAFNYVLLAGILCGTYSSVAVASPLLLGFKQAIIARTAGAVAR